MKGRRRGVGYDVLILISKQHATLNNWQLILISLHVYLSICLSVYTSVNTSVWTYTAVFLRLYIKSPKLLFIACACVTDRAYR